MSIIDNVPLQSKPKKLPLKPKPSANGQPHGLTVQQLAEAKQLPADWLREIGLQDCPNGVYIPYFDPAGNPIRGRIRTALDGESRFHWETPGNGVHAYGQWRLQDARNVGILYLVEGESDCWALWHHGVPALGIPGSDAAGCLQAEYLEGVPIVYVNHEQDGGKHFVEGVRKRLVQLGYAGQARFLTLQVKDPADLHALHPEQNAFCTALEQSTEIAQPLTLSPAGKPVKPAAPPKDDPPPNTFPEPMKAGAFHGLAGEIVACLGPQSEAAPEALLAQLLVCFGNAMGRSAYRLVEGGEHYMNEFILLIGDTAQGGKGGSWVRINNIMQKVDPDWADHCILEGLASGEALIDSIRDESTKLVKGEFKTDPGVEDKRLLVLAEEFARVMRKANAEKSILSEILRGAWDGRPLRNRSLGNHVKVNRPHVSAIGHCTPTDLWRYIGQTEASNGFANRFMPLAVRRSKKLPDGGEAEPHGLAALIEDLKDVLEHARQVGEVGRDPEAGELWKVAYNERLTEPGPGITGALLSRGAPHVMRLSCLYALLDQEQVIRRPHLEAALAFWDYCERSVHYLFSKTTGNRYADRIEKELLAVRPAGLTNSAITALFANHITSHDKETALDLLKVQQRAHTRKVENPKNGQHYSQWFWGPLPSDLAKSANSAES